MTQLPIRQLSEADGVGGTTPFAPVTVPEAVMLPDGSTMNKVIGSVAVIETSPAAASHAAGDYIVWNGQLYKVTAAISAGQTLTVGTNITATTAGAELKSLNNDLNKVGTYYSETVVTNAIPHATETVSARLTLPAGVYIVTYNTSLNGLPSATQMQSAVRANGTTVGNFQNFSKYGGSSLLRQIVTCIISVSGTSNTINGAVYQASGSELTLLDNRLRAVRLK